VSATGAPSSPTPSRGTMERLDENEQEKSQNAILSWAIASLATGTLQDEEQGEYFTWLAKIVLHSIPESPAAASTAKQQEDATGVQGPVLLIGIQRSVTSRVVKIVQPEEAAAQGAAGGDGPQPAFSQRRLAVVQSQEELEDLAECAFEVLGDSKLPDAALNACRLGVGLQTLLSDADKNEGEDKLDIEVAKPLFSSPQWIDRCAKGGGSIAQRMKRKARGSKVIVALRGCGVPDGDLDPLRAELENSANSSTQSSDGVLLLGGCQRCAQILLITAQVAKKVVGGHHDPSASSTSARNPLLPSSAQDRHRRPLESIVSVSHRNARDCYSAAAAGFGGEWGAVVCASNQSVAVALQFLERALFQPEKARETLLSIHGVAKACSPERAAEVVPSIFPQAVVRRLAAQERLREEVANATLTSTASPRGARNPSQSNKSYLGGFSRRSHSRPGSPNEGDLSPSFSASPRSETDASPPRNLSLGTSPRESSSSRAAPPRRRLETKTTPMHGHLILQVRMQDGEVFGTTTDLSAEQMQKRHSPTFQQEEAVYSPEAADEANDEVDLAIGQTDDAGFRLPSASPPLYGRQRMFPQQWPSDIRGLLDDVTSHGERLWGSIPSHPPGKKQTGLKKVHSAPHTLPAVGDYVYEVDALRASLAAGLAATTFGRKSWPAAREPCFQRNACSFVELNVPEKAKGACSSAVLGVAFERGVSDYMAEMERKEREGCRSALASRGSRESRRPGIATAPGRDALSRRSRRSQAKDQ